MAKTKPGGPSEGSRRAAHRRAVGPPPTAMFSPTDAAHTPAIGSLEYVALDDIVLADNPRRDIDQDDIDDLARMLLTHGQTKPCGGRRTDDGKVRIYAGQQRKLAADRTRELVKQDAEWRGSKPISGIWVLLRDDLRSEVEWRRYQAQENAGIPLSFRDEQDMFAYFWEAAAGLPEDQRLQQTRLDCGFSAATAQNHRRQLVLPQAIRHRVARRPKGDQISIGVANQLADIYNASPPLAGTVADWITTPARNSQAATDIQAAVLAALRTSEDAYAVALHHGTSIDAAQALRDTVPELQDDKTIARAAGILGCGGGEVPARLVALTHKAQQCSAQIAITEAVQDRAITTRCAWVHRSDIDREPMVLLIDPVFMIDLVMDAIRGAKAPTDAPAPTEPPAKPQADPSPSNPRTDADSTGDLDPSSADRRPSRSAVARNLGLGQDITAGLLTLSADQADGLRIVVCRLLASQYGDALAFGAAWTSRDRQQRTKQMAPYTPMDIDVIVALEVERALADADPLRGIAQLATRIAASVFLDPEGAITDGPLDAERVTPKTHEVAATTDRALWDLMRPMLSPAVVAMHRDTYAEPTAETPVPPLA
ncbi:MAG: ParB N-terminal domain-containing protein [Solirubrobacteraceae bacterium]|nr:ParB N-terminal domain-containing protein [Solirubrobacteraceae bacterium]